VEYVKEKGGRFLMKDEQGRYFEMDTQAVEQLELPVREFVEIGKLDILSVKGGGGNYHLGNKRFRNIVSKTQSKYKGATRRTVKIKLSKAIVEHVKQYGGRYLRKDPNGRYFKMAEPEAVRKTSQALREKNKFKLIGGIEDEDDAFYELVNRIAERG
jgi:hypothetical protein